MQNVLLYQFLLSPWKIQLLHLMLQNIPRLLSIWLVLFQFLVLWLNVCFRRFSSIFHPFRNLSLILTSCSSGCIRISILCSSLLILLISISSSILLRLLCILTCVLLLVSALFITSTLFLLSICRWLPSTLALQILLLLLLHVMKQID